MSFSFMAMDAKPFAKTVVGANAPDIYMPEHDKQPGIFKRLFGHQSRTPNIDNAYNDLADFVNLGRNGQS
jgi:hypothetical protein